MEENAWEVGCRKVRLGGRWDGGRLVGGRMKENVCEVGWRMISWEAGWKRMRGKWYVGRLG